MKGKALIAAATVVASGSLIAGSALGSSSGDSGITWSHRTNGVWCKTGAGGVACVPMTGKGYGIGFHKDYVMVMRLSDSKVIFQRYQPGY